VPGGLGEWIVMKYLLMVLIRLYQMTLSKALPSSCRFYPSCSNYGYEAVVKHGAVKGGWLTIKRLSRCQPFHPGGYDPVP